MDSTPQQPNEGDRFETVLREHHKLARQFDVYLKDLADYFRENLAETTRHLLIAVPQQMDAWREEAVRKYGYDPERGELGTSLDQSVKSAEDAQGLVALLNHYNTYRLVIKLWKWWVQSGLSGERLQMAVCQSVIEAYRQRPGFAAKGIEALEAGMPGFPQGLALSVYLTTHVAVHTSLRKNRRLRDSIDELRTDDESRFSRLLKELPAEVLAAYHEREAGWGDLMDVRTEVVRRLEKVEARPEVQDLVAFAQREREAVLKRGREAGLPPREYELLKLLVDKPNTSSREAGEALNITPGAVRALKSRIYRTLGVA
jgi:DNA-binding CsgD family transcriptional regulator